MKRNIEVIIPESLDDVRLEDFILYTIFEQDEELSELDKIYKSFKVFLKLDKEEVDLIPVEMLEEMYSKLIKSFSVEYELKNRFISNGVEYGMIPNLDKLNMGEYVDLDNFITPSFKGEIKHIDAFKFMAVLFRPIKKKTWLQKFLYGDSLYTIEEYDFQSPSQSWENMKDIPVSIYLAALRFFFHLRKELLQSSSRYLTELVKQLKEESISIKDGDGMDQLTHLLTEISQNGNMYFPYLLKNVFMNSHSIKRIMNSQKVKEKNKTI